MNILAPGKLILSGEHSVVYGRPALAMAVNRYVCVRVLESDKPVISLNFADLAYKRGITLNALNKLKHRIRDKYLSFKNSHVNIREVLQKPFELAQFALSLCLENLKIKLSEGMQMDITSTIPIGCGMGSSAATILGIIHAMAHYVKAEVSPKTIYELGLQAENMQHGISSGLDLYVSLYGGCCYVKDTLVTAKPLPSIPLYLINTGTPQTTTGECVTAVAPYFKKTSIGDDFASVTESMLTALYNDSFIEFKSAVAANHDLLNKIGVVPLGVQQFIRDIHLLGGAAKICGAGAIAGNNAGIVMALMDDACALNTLCVKYGYEMLSVAGETRGVHVSV